MQRFNMSNMTFRITGREVGLTGGRKKRERRPPQWTAQAKEISLPGRQEGVLSWGKDLGGAKAGRREPLAGSKCTIVGL